MRLKKRTKISYVKYIWAKPIGSVSLRRFKYQAISLLYVTVLMTTPLAVLLKSGVSEASAPYKASDVLGQPDFTSTYRNGQSANFSGLRKPIGETIDPIHHRLFIADNSNHRVLVYNLNGSNGLIDTAADFVLGQPDFNSLGSGAAINRMHFPEKMAYDGVHDRLFVGDVANNRVLVFDTANITNGEDAVHVLGQPDFTSSGGDLNAKGFDQPRSLSYDAINDMLYVGDFNNNRVLVFDTGTITDNEDAVHVLGQPNFTTNGGNLNQKGFNHVFDVGYEETTNTLYVADFSNNRVMVFDVSTITDNEDAVHVLGQPDYSSSGADTNAKGFSNIRGLSVDPIDHTLYVSEENNRRILVFDVSTITDNEDAVHVLGQPDFTSSTGGLDAKSFEGTGESPWGIMIDSSAHMLYAADSRNNRVLVFDTGTITDNEDAVQVLGQPDFTSGGANFSPISPGGFDNDGISPVLDSVHHRLFVSNSKNCRVLIYNLDNNNNLISHTPNNVLGQSDLTSRICSNTAATFNFQGGIAFDSVNDRLFVADVYANCRVMIFDTSSISNGEAAINILGGNNINTAGGCGLSPSTFDPSYYGAVAYDETTKLLYVSDSYYNYRILVFDLSSGITDGMDASHVLGAPDLSTAGAGDVSSTGVYADYGNLVIDTVHHRLFFGSYSQMRVMVFDVASIVDGEPAAAVLGQPDPNTSVSGTSAQGGGGVVGLGFDPVKQLLFVSEYDNGRILIYNVASLSDGQDAIGVIGAPDFVTPGSGYTNSEATQTSIRPYDQANITFDGINRRMYYGDDVNARMLVFDFPNITSGDNTATITIPNATFGQPYDYQIPISGTQGTVTCSLESGVLPKNVVITPDCHVKGTPASNTPYTFTVKVTDDNGAVGVYSDSQVLGLTVNHADGSLADTGSNSRLTGVLALALITVSASVLVRTYGRRNLRRYIARSGR